MQTIFVTDAVIYLTTDATLGWATKSETINKFEKTIVFAFEISAVENPITCAVFIKSILLGEFIQLAFRGARLREVVK
jgi:hypothetical protein